MSQAKTPEEYMQLLGRDGAYVEYEISKLSELVKLAKQGDEFPKMITLLCGRLELSDVNDVKAFRNALQSYADNPETTGMSPEQLGFYVFKKIFETGIRNTRHSYPIEGEGLSANLKE